MSLSSEKSRREWLVFSGKKEDFAIFSERFVARMRRQKLHLVLHERNVIPDVPVLPDEPTAPQQTEYNKLVKEREDEIIDAEDKSDQIYCELVTYLDNESLMFIRHDCKLPDGSGNGVKAWKMLCGRFESKEKPAVMAITSQLTSLRLEADEKVSCYLSRAQELVSQLRNAGETMSDSLVNSFTLQGLPSEYESFVTMESFHPSSSSVELRQRIQVFADSREQKKGAQETQQLAFLSRNGRGDGSRVVCFRCNQPGHVAKVCKAAVPSANFSRGSSGGKAQVKCHNCGKIGHVKAHCWAKGGGSEGKGPKGKAQAMSTTYHALHGEVRAEALVAAADCSFVLDSGCTDHMLNDRKLFTEYTPCGDGKVVFSANRSTSQVAGQGTAEIVVNDDRGNGHVLVLKDALHVPDHGRNLFSVKCAVGKGSSVTLSSEGSCLQLPDGTQIPVQLDSNLFTVRCEPCASGQCNTAASSVGLLGLWHRRMGHVNMKDLETVLRQSFGELKWDFSGGGFCETCALGKATKASVPKMTYNRSSAPMERVFSDVCGPFALSLGGCRYAITFIDDYSRHAVVKFMAKKSEALFCFKEFVSEFGPPKSLRSDNGGEFVSKDFEEFCRGAGVVREFTVPETPEQNGVAERFFRTSVEMARCLLLDAQLPSSFWVRAVDTAVYIRNRCPSRALEKAKTPFEAFFGKVPKIKHMRVFGCAAYVLNRSWEQSSKLEGKAHKAKFVGYDCRSPAYLVYNLATRKIEKVRNVEFNEADLQLESKVTASQDFHLEEFEELVSGEVGSQEGVCSGAEAPSAEIGSGKNGFSSEPSCAGLEEEEPDSGGEASVSDIADVQSEGDSSGSKPRVGGEERPKRRHNAPPRFDEFLLYNPDSDFIEALTAESSDPKNYGQAMASPEASEWQNAMRAEYDALVDNETWDLVVVPPGRKVVGGKWVYKVKRDQSGDIEKFKARYVAQGFSQIPGLDFKETYAPTARPETIRLVFAVAAQYDCILEQMDVKSAYLHSKIEEEIFLQQPEGFVQL